MNIFLDTAHLPSIQQWISTGLISGITTNPSHLSKESGDLTALLKTICATMGTGDVSIEITEQSPEAVYKQAQRIARLAPNVVVKIPCHQDYYPIIKKLINENIPLNITLVFTLIQGLFMSKLGVKYISPFVGRWDDIDIDGLNLVRELRTMVDRYQFSTRILAASLRDIRHIHGAIQTGADCATIPPALLEKATRHPLTQQGMDIFNTDWAQMGIKQFP